jgi:ATP synthase protein I
MTDERRSFAGEVQARADRKLKALRAGPTNIWPGLGMLGVIGWSVAVPTLLGVLLGRWLDGGHPRPVGSWTLMMLFAGLGVGCANAWYWIAKEQAALRKASGGGDA